MNKINGMTTVNNGEIKKFNADDPLIKGGKLIVELRRADSESEYNVMFYYMWDKKLALKQVLAIYKNTKTGEYGADIFYYTNSTSINHYRRLRYPDMYNLPTKYNKIVQYLMPFFMEVFK